MKKPKLFLEVADTHSKRAEGLMFREKLASDAGMMFRFPEKREMSFWMKDTPLPLDIAFLDDDMRVAEIREMIPYSTRPTRSDGSYRYAIEVNSGWFERNGIQVGSVISAARGISFEEEISPGTDVPTQDSPPMPTGDLDQEPPSQPEVRQSPEVAVNMSFREAVGFADDNDLAIAFDYEFPEGNVNSYILIPSGDYEIKTGRSGELVCGRCVHSGGEYRNFMIDNVLVYDLYRYGGDGAGERVEIPAPAIMSPEPSVMVATSEANVRISDSDMGIIKESQSYSASGQLMMTEYWDEIKKKKGKGKSEGQAILDYLAENSKRNSPKKKSKKKKKKKK